MSYRIDRICCPALCFCLAAAVFLTCPFLATGCSAAQEKILISVRTDNTPGLESSTIFAMEPDASARRPIFDFKWNMFDSRGGIWGLAVGNSGRSIFFSSDNGYMWTPLGGNLFSIRSDGSGFDQLTPLPDSGNWNAICQQCGTVEGYVKKSNGDPWGAAPVFIEGMGMTNAMPDGSFRFENVPPGIHNVVAYRTGQPDVFTFTPVQVAAGAVSSTGVLVPDSSGRLSMGRPDFFKGSLYFTQSHSGLKRMDISSGAVSDIYSPSQGSCSSVTGITGFDVAPVSGNIAIVDYATGCTDHQGVYLTDSSGRSIAAPIDFKSGSWCGAGEVAWSPDEKMLAVTACYNWTNYGLVILDPSSLNILGMTWLPSQSEATFINFHLHGWSPDGKWLLYSLWGESPDNTVLTRIRVDSSAQNMLLPNNAAEEQQVFSGPLDSAVWAEIDTPDQPPAPVMTVAVSGQKVRCAWSQVEGADGYMLYYAPHPAMSPIGNVDMGKQTGFSVEFPSGSAYYIAVWPYNSRGDTFGLSNIAQFFVK